MSGDAGLPIYVDVDDVLADTTATLLELAHGLFGVRVAFDDCRSFDLGESFGLSETQRDRLLDAAHADDVIESMGVVDGAPEVLRRWHEAGQRIHIVTGRPPSTMAATRRWLVAAGFPFGRLESIDKYGRYRHLPESAPLHSFAGRRFAFAVEDSTTMTRFLVERTGTPVILIDKPWNRSLDVPASSSAPWWRAHSWRDIEERAQEILLTGKY